jgi:hypothetical protein
MAPRSYHNILCAGDKAFGLLGWWLVELLRLSWLVGLFT